MDCRVNRVFGTAVAEHGATDRDLGKLNRKYAVGIVDRQQYFSATKRSTG